MAHQNKKQHSLANVKQEEKAKKVRRIVTVVIIVTVTLAILIGTLAILFVNGVFGNREEYQKLAQDRKTVATCNGFDIPYEELVFLTTLYKNSLAFSYGEDIWDDPATAEQYRDELETLVMENLNENYLILSTCKYLSIDTNSSLVEEYVDQQMKEILQLDYNGDKKKMLEDFEADGLTEHYMRFLIGVEYLQSSIYYTLLEADLYDFSTDNIGEFIDYVMESENYARTIHYYVRNDEGDDVEANRAKAQNVVDKIREAATYTERIDRMHTFMKYSEDTQMVSKNGYYFTLGEMEEAYETAAFALRSTEVSDVIELNDGFFVIMRLDPEQDYVTTNVQTLLQNYQSAAMGAYIQRFEKDCQVVMNEYGKSLDLLNLQ